MKKTCNKNKKLLFIFFAITFYLPCLLGQFYQREEINFNENWKFKRDGISAGESGNYNDSTWEIISIPHTWNNMDGQDGGANYYRGSSWYRKQYAIPENYFGKRVFIKFEASNIVSTLYLNGRYVSQHKGGDAAFAFDITDYLIYGKVNLFAVRVHNLNLEDVAPLKGDWTKMGGINRSVKLILTNPTHICLLDYGSPGVYLIQTNVSNQSADLKIKVKISNDDVAAKKITINSRIMDASGQLIKSIDSDIKMIANSNSEIIQNTVIKNPHLWNGIKDPYLYKAIITVKYNNEILDQIEQPLGFRFFHVDKDKGFFLNGEYYDLHGVALHESRKDKGNAINDLDREEDINIILEMGATWVRLSHYQHAEKVYELADRKGLIVWTEVPYMRTVNLPEYTENLKQKFKELIRQNYNHPSVCFWSVFNEITEDEKNINPYSFTLVDEMNKLVKEEDPTRLSACASFPRGGENIDYKWYTDVTGFNLYIGWYSGNPEELGPYLDNIHKNFPNKKFAVSEYGAGASLFTHEEEVTRPDPQSVYHPEEYQSKFHEIYWKELQKRQFIWAKTIWNGFDFAADDRSEGDQTGINDKGLVTYDRKTKKDAYYWYKANWTNDPFVYITSRRFTDRDSIVKLIKIYSTCDSVDLLINKISVGKKVSADKVFIWNDIPLKRGENSIKTIGYKNSQVYTDDCIWTSRSKVLSIRTSSSLNQIDAYKAVDNNLETYWFSAKIPQWIEVELPSVQSIRYVEIIPKDSKIYKYYIEASIDGKTYTKILDRINNSSISKTKWKFAHPYIKDPTPGKGKYIKLTITGCHECPDDNIAIEEFRIVAVPLDK